MKRILGTILLSVILVQVIMAGKRNLLSDHFTRKLLGNSLVNDFQWVKYPAYSNRNAWNKIPEGIRKSTIANGEKYLGYSWPITTASMYLEFIRTGNRAIVDGAISTRLTVLRSLAMAELSEGEGRFMDDLINGVFSFCEQTYWGMSATFYMYRTGSAGSDKPNTVLPDLNDPIIDLSAGDTAADLAWIWYFFHTEFDKISPVISKRLVSELKKKILNPFYERYDYWWLTGSGAGIVNNWNPWCNHNMLTCIMLIEDDPVKREAGIYKTMESVDLFINSYPDDGACDEGPTYWAVAGGKLFDYLNLLKQVTNGKIDIFNQEIIKNIGRYIFRVYISSSPGGQFYANYSDASAKVQQDGGRIVRYGNEIKDNTLTDFGYFLLEKSDFLNIPAAGRMGEVLENLFNLGVPDRKLNSFPLITEYYFPDRDIAIARDNSNNSGFCFIAKGGSNGEGHNHNDVGSGMLYFNGSPVLIDVGVGTYTAKTFSSRRYEIWTMQSEYHNLPVINGFGQSPGGTFRAKNSVFKPATNKVFYSTDISGAYPPEAQVQEWIRSYLLERGKKFLITDRYQLKDNKSGIALHLMTPVKCQVLKPGIIELKADQFRLHLKYKPRTLNVQIETVKIDDNWLHKVWGDEIFRLVFTDRNSNLSGLYSIEIIQAN
jgi:hypothetical protein